MRFVLAGIILVTSIMSLQSAFAQYYNTTTGNYGEDPNNPNSADNIIIKYCLDHADRVGQVRMLSKTWYPLIWFLYIMMEKHVNRSMTNIQRFCQEFDFNKQLAESRERLLKA